MGIDRCICYQAEELKRWPIAEDWPRYEDTLQSQYLMLENTYSEVHCGWYIVLDKKKLKLQFFGGVQWFQTTPS
jgi:hypothetical protein